MKWHSRRAAAALPPPRLPPYTEGFRSRRPVHHAWASELTEPSHNRRAACAAPRAPTPPAPRRDRAAATPARPPTRATHRRARRLSACDTRLSQMSLRADGREATRLEEWLRVLLSAMAADAHVPLHPAGAALACLTAPHGAPPPPHESVTVAATATILRAAHASPSTLYGAPPLLVCSGLQALAIAQPRTAHWVLSPRPPHIDDAPPPGAPLHPGAAEVDELWPPPPLPTRALQKTLDPSGSRLGPWLAQLPAAETAALARRDGPLSSKAVRLACAAEWRAGTACVLLLTIMTDCAAAVTLCALALPMVLPPLASAMLFSHALLQIAFEVAVALRRPIPSGGLLLRWTALHIELAAAAATLAALHLVVDNECAAAPAARVAFALAAALRWLRLRLVGCFADALAPAAAMVAAAAAVGTAAAIALDVFAPPPESGEGAPADGTCGDDADASRAARLAAHLAVALAVVAAALAPRVDAPLERLRFVGWLDGVVDWLSCAAPKEAGPRGLY